MPPGPRGQEKTELKAKGRMRQRRGAGPEVGQQQSCRFESGGWLEGITVAAPPTPTPQLGLASEPGQIRNRASCLQSEHWGLEPGFVTCTSHHASSKLILVIQERSFLAQLRC